MAYHWTTRHALKMPAKLFFAMLREAKILKREESCRMLMHMTDISFVPSCTFENYQALRNKFYEGSLTTDDLKYRQHERDLLDRRTTENKLRDRKQESAVLLSLFKGTR